MVLSKEENDTEFNASVTQTTDPPFSCQAKKKPQYVTSLMII